MITRLAEKGPGIHVFTCYGPSLLHIYISRPNAFMSPSIHHVYLNLQIRSYEAPHIAKRAPSAAT